MNFGDLWSAAVLVLEREHEPFIVAVHVRRGMPSESGLVQFVLCPQCSRAPTVENLQFVLGHAFTSAGFRSTRATSQIIPSTAQPMKIHGRNGSDVCTISAVSPIATEPNITPKASLWSPGMAK